MESLVIYALLAAAGCGAFILACKAAAALADEPRRPLPTIEAQRRYQAQQRYQEQQRRLNLLARNLQIALLQLNRAPDFRRAARIATTAQAVPLTFRQRQFRRFRARFIAYMAGRLQAGGDAEVLTQSLAELLQQLGVAPFEADYIRTEAERLFTAPRETRAIPYSQRLAQLQRDHEQRREALRQLKVDPETRDQLLEAEETRFLEALQATGATDDPLH